MKNLILFVFALMLLTLSCDRDDDDTVETSYEAIGTIAGQDLTLCACCGGYLIQLEDSAEIFNFESLPDNSEIDLKNEVYPLSVRVNWTGGISEACSNIIRIDAIKRE